MSRKLRMGVVGLGGIWNWAHSEPMTKHPEVEIVAVCDIVKEKADHWAKEVGARPYTDYNDMIRAGELDFVDICTPNLFHSKIAVAALGAGMNVFTEKPDAVSVAEATKMVEAARKSGKVLMSMRNNRWRPDSLWLKKFIDAGHMGEIYTGRAGWIRRRGIPGKGGWFTTKALSGGGPLIDLGVHMTDLAIWLMGDPAPVAVSGCTYRKFAESGAADSIHSSFGNKVAGGTFDVEDLATGFIRFGNGASLAIEFSWASNIEVEQIYVELRGTKAGSHQGPQGLKIFSENEAGIFDMVPKVGKNPRGDHAMMLHHFVDVLMKRAKPIIKPEHGLNMIKVLSAMYESAEKGREVKL